MQSDFSWTTQAERYVELYRLLLGSGKSDPAEAP